MQANGYQLGRGLAECFWALDAKSTDGWDSWGFLYSDLRCDELTRLCGRLSDYMNSFAASAITGSLQVWKLLASDEKWRVEGDVPQCLYEQIRTWYELSVLGQDPSRNIKPFHLIRNWRVTYQAAKTFFVQLLLGAVGLVALFFLVLLLSSKTPSHLLEALTSALATVGISTAGITGKLKNQAQSLWTRIGQDAYTDLIAAEITVVPPPPDRSHGRNIRVVIERNVSKRDLTVDTAFR